MDSIYSILTERLHYISNDYCCRLGKRPKLCFVIGLDWWMKVMENQHFAPFSNPEMAHNEVKFQGSRGAVVNGYNGLAIWIEGDDKW